MARTVKPEEFAAKRGEILDAAQRLVLTKGYEQMSIQDILDYVRISSGAFHHYFDSRRALLDALIERIQQESEKPLLPIIHDPQLNAIEKLQGFFDTLDRLRSARKADVVKLVRVWYNDDNAIVRQKVDDAVLAQRAPLLTKIVRQGIQEGIFTISHPDKAGEVILSLLQGMGNTHARLLLSLEHEANEQRNVEEIVSTHAAYMEAIERVLGAPPNSLHRTDAAAVKVWIEAIRENSDHA
ncbi:TetR/AcrR family transcriptional regulator [Dictyobacter formicarum]|uniref:TetR family transcriptional regulator n=1 Tax=Dictyobacter formicarum TaxID=2778368 RepID=A0ABQ3VK41_9CHLR|nr:TetR/AcrR family transcriptional regulator [Dictyobacter formicarum]GHO85728.1 TetR family transcriptional regulator [Dictyobacter formicarum]